MNIWSATFKDPDGSLSIPEIMATLHAVASIGAIAIATAAFVRNTWIKDLPPDYVAFGTGIAALVAGVSVTVAALGAAQRIRDGQTRHDGDHE